MKTAVLLLVAVLPVLPALSTAAGVPYPYEFERIGAFGLAVPLLPPDARSDGMGGAYLALAAGPAGSWWNAGALLEGRDLSCGFTWADQPFQSEIFSYAAFNLSLEWRGLRFGYHQGRLATEEFAVPIPVGPPDRVEIGDFKQIMRLVGLSCDVGSYFFPDRPRLQWGFGVNFKHFDNDFFGDSLNASDFDVGTAVAWRGDLSRARGVPDRFAVRGGLAWQNVKEGEIGDTGLRLAQRLRFGMAVEGRFLFREPLGHLLRLTFAFDGEEATGRGGDSIPGGSYYGSEAVLAGVVALRAGHRDEGEGARQGWGWGVGLMVDVRSGDRPVQLLCDYARAPAPEDLDDAENRFGLSLAADF